jgi:phospholipid transport system substrate-binding protein
MKKNHLFGYLILCLTLLLGFTQRALAGGDPSQMLQSVANQMVDALRSHKATLSSNPSVVYSLAYKIVVPHADLDEMSKRVLPAQVWSNATPEQRSQFKKEFTTLLVRTYASALADYTDETVQVYPVRGGYAGKSSVVVQSQIVRSNGPAIPVSYRVFLRGSEWKLYDMTVEGVSMLQSFRSQFADKLSQGNMSNLLTAIREHNAANGGN